MAEWDYRNALDVLDELENARKKFAPMHGPHEGYAVLLEEMDELWDEVKAHAHDRERMRAEAIQVAAMAVRFATDVCGPRADRPAEESDGSGVDDA